jgi:hypothetical protein
MLSIKGIRTQVKFNVGNNITKLRIESVVGLPERRASAVHYTIAPYLRDPGGAGCGTAGFIHSSFPPPFFFAFLLIGIKPSHFHFCKHLPTAEVTSTLSKAFPPTPNTRVLRNEG